MFKQAIVTEIIGFQNFSFLDFYHARIIRLTMAYSSEVLLKRDGKV